MVMITMPLTVLALLWGWMKLLDLLDPTGFYRNLHPDLSSYGFFAIIIGCILFFGYRTLRQFDIW